MNEHEWSPSQRLRETEAGRQVIIHEEDGSINVIHDVNGDVKIAVTGIPLMTFASDIADGLVKFVKKYITEGNVNKTIEMLSEDKEMC